MVFGLVRLGGAGDILLSLQGRGLRILPYNEGTRDIPLLDR